MSDVVLVYTTANWPRLASSLFHGSSEAMTAFLEDHEELSDVEVDFFVWIGKVVQAAMLCLSKGDMLLCRHIHVINTVKARMNKDWNSCIETHQMLRG
jgi:hypothetical protein